MLCEYVGPGGDIRGPFKYDRSTIGHRLTRWGVKFKNLPGTLTKAIDLDGGMLYPVEVNKPAARPSDEITLESRVVGQDKIIYTYRVEPRNAQALRMQLLERVAGRHALYELGYTELQGVAIRTDLEARINVSETLKQFKSGKLTSAKWRGKNGKIPINSADDLQQVYDAIFTYLHNGFIAKEVAEDAIANAGDEALHELDPVGVFESTLNSLENPS